MKRKTWRKSIAVLLVFAMMMTIMPMAAFAADEPEATNPESTQEQFVTPEPTQNPEPKMDSEEPIIEEEEEYEPTEEEILAALEAAGQGLPAPQNETGEEETVTYTVALAETSVTAIVGETIKIPDLTVVENKELTATVKEVAVESENDAVVKEDGTLKAAFEGTATVTVTAEIVVAEATEDTPAVVEEATATLAVTVKAAEELQDGVNNITESQSDKTYVVDDGKALAIDGTAAPVVMENCTFKLSGKTLKLDGFDNSYYAKIGTKGTVQFVNCTIVADKVENIGAAIGVGTDAVVAVLKGETLFDTCTMEFEGSTGQSFGVYGGTATVQNSTVNATACKGWIYAIYSSGNFVADNSTLNANSVKPEEKNTNCFYSESSGTVTIQNGTVIDFSNNSSGGFALNNTSIIIKDSTVNVDNNAGNGSNTGYWNVTNSTLSFCGNKTHGLSCKGLVVTDSTLTALHNGYVGISVNNTVDGLTATNSTVIARCNGERALSYSGGDVFIRANAEFNNCPFVYLGNVGHYYSPTVNCEVINNGCAYFMATTIANDYKTGNFAGPITLPEITVGTDKHMLYRNPDTEKPYFKAVTTASCDVDLITDENMAQLSNKENPSFAEFTEADLSHHIYNWKNGTVKQVASADKYGIASYECTDVCADYANNTDSHPTSFNCAGVHVYAPLVGLAFHPNTGDAEKDAKVTNMPADQDSIDYNGNADKPRNPSRDGYTFTGWFADEECTQAFDFTTALTDNWTDVYAGWKENSGGGGDDPIPTPTPKPDPNPNPTPVTPIPDPVVPQGEPEIIPEEDVPLVDVPGEEVIEDNPTPQAELPADVAKTGDSSNAVAFAMALLVAGFGLAITRRKFN